MSEPQIKTTSLADLLWFVRARLGGLLIMAGMRVLPRCRYRRELSASLWTLNLKVQAHCAAIRSAEKP